MTLEQKLQKLGRMVQQKRSREHLSLRKAADEIEVSFNVIARLEQGKIPTAESLVKLLLWHPETRPHIQAILSVLDPQD